MIIPSKETAEEEFRPRPASLRQQPKRRFSMYVPSPNETQPSTSSTQPPISLRLKRISDPLSDEQKMPPPRVFKMMPIKKAEKVDVTTLDLINVCNYCEFESNLFENVYSHWLRVHKKGDDPISKRFCYRVTKKVKCVYCTDNVTFQTIRAHVQSKHPDCAYIFAKHTENSLYNQIQCGVCSKDVDNIAQLETHFSTDHPQCQKTDWKFEPLPIINDFVLDVLLQQGDQGTFKCIYCRQYFPSRYDYEQHHNEYHPTNERKYELNGKDIIKYRCFICRTIKSDEGSAIEHLRSHIPSWFQCLHCPKKLKQLRTMQVHHQMAHEELEIAFKVVSARDSLNSYYQMILTFSNGLTLTWGDVVNTKYGGVDRLMKYVNQLDETQRQQQLNLLRSNSGGKICQRRQTLL